MGIRPGAIEFPAWVPRRPGAAAAALALNAALGLALFLCFRSPESSDTNAPVSTLTWLPLSAPAASPTKPPRMQTPHARTSRPHARLESLSPIVPSVAPISIAPAQGPVDWWAEGERVVKDRARAAAPGLPDDRIDLHTGSRAEAPAHQAGESYQDELGDKVVWVSDECYIESDPPLPGTPPAFAAARTTRVYCPGAGGAPRGDLFKDVPAYRKYHPEAP